METEGAKNYVMITIPESIYEKMPADIKAMFEKLPNDGSEEVLGAFPETKSGKMNREVSAYDGASNTSFLRGRSGPDNQHGDSGSAARFFYCAKASKKDRGEGNNHPTVKPTALMEYLVKLVAPEGALVLDPFGGSGTTAIACLRTNRRFILMERDAESVAIANRRIENEGV